jgi:hypothetical protein
VCPGIVQKWDKGPASWPALLHLRTATQSRGRSSDPGGDRQKLWHVDTFVDFEHGLNTSIKKLRQALSDSATEPCYIETLPRLGYRFIAPVQVSVEPIQRMAAAADETPSAFVAPESEPVRPVAGTGTAPQENPSPPSIPGAGGHRTGCGGAAFECGENARAAL